MTEEAKVGPYRLPILAFRFPTRENKPRCKLATSDVKGYRYDRQHVTVEEPT